MAKISRKEARDILFGLLFEVEFKQEENPTEIYNLSCENREIPGNDYIKNVFFGVITSAEVIDAVISKYSKGWRSDRLSRVSRTVLRIAIYEILFVDDIHPNISISQAVELVVKYGEDKAQQFVNGVLSGVYRDWEKDGAEAIISAALAFNDTDDACDEELSDKADEE
jgi:N utilization substance protein B